MELRLGRRFLVLSEPGAVGAGDRIPLILGRGKAFGSGEHETTRSCLEELESLPCLQDLRVLDLGCGTGILALAAAKLGAGRVVALDTDARAVNATLNNVRLNNVEDRVLTIHGSLDMVRGERFDLIVANLYGDILLALARDLTELLEGDSLLVLSGILLEYAFELREKMKRLGFVILKYRILGEYSTLVLRKARA